VPVGGAVERTLHGTETSSVFQDKNGNRCFLNVNRNDGKRKLNLVNVDDNWNADNDWMFLEALFSPASLSWLGGSFLFSIQLCLNAFLPAADHAADLVELFRKRSVPLLSDALVFPCNLQEELHAVEL
jgi:hypothetical protein